MLDTDIHEISLLYSNMENMAGTDLVTESNTLLSDIKTRLAILETKTGILLNEFDLSDRIKSKLFDIISEINILKESII